MLFGMYPRFRFRLALLAFTLSGSVHGNMQVVAQALDDAGSQVRHIGPLIVVSSHVRVDDPEQIAHELLNGKPDERPITLQAMGVDSDPSIHQLWVNPRKGKDSASPAQRAKSWISTAIPDLVYGPGTKPYKVIHVGVDDLGEQPFWIDSIFKQEASQWYRVAIVACLCLGNRAGDIEFTASPKRPKVNELEFRFNTSLGTNAVWSDQIVRFRFKNDTLEPVFEKEGYSMNCPSGIEPGKLCTVEIVNLTPSEFIDQTGHRRSGSILMRSEGTTQNFDKMALLSKPLNCTPYIWDEEKFAYEIVNYKAKACRGVPADKTLSPN